MSKRVAAFRSRARWWSGRVAVVLGAGVALNCGASGDDGALFAPMDPVVTGDTTGGTPTGTSSGGAATTTAATAGSNTVSGAVITTTATASSTTTGATVGSVGQGGNGGAGGPGTTTANGGTAGVTGTGGMGGTGATSSGGTGGGANGTGGGGTGGSGTGGGGTGGASTTGNGGVGGSAGGTEPLGGAGGALGGAAGASGCGFEQRPNTVYFALDRSSSMIDDDFWNPVKEGVLDTVAAMQDRMRFGFAAFTGQYDLTCPLDLTASANITLDNLAGISAVLDPLEPPDPEGVKGETPTAAAIDAVRAKLALDPSPGEVYVLLITDGDPDFCNDTEAACPSDALVYELQGAFLEGIETRVFNIAGGGATASRLETFARAGRGLSVRGNSRNIYNTCLTDATWAARHSALGLGEGDSLGNYMLGAPAGSYVTLDPSDATALSATLVAETAGLLSCFFDLEGGTLAEGGASAVSVELAGQPLEYDGADGWKLHQGSLLELTGDACSTYRSASAPTLRIDVECDVLE